MKILVGFSRIFVGVLFIISGLIKLNDPVGFSFKLKDYFAPEVLNLEFLVPYALMIAIFVGWFMNQSTIIEELEIKSPKIYQSWLWTLRVVSPLGVIAVFANTLGWF